MSSTDPSSPNSSPISSPTGSSVPSLTIVLSVLTTMIVCQSISIFFACRTRRRRQTSQRPPPPSSPHTRHPPQYFPPPISLETEILASPAGTCPVCLEELSPGHLATTLHCQHVFHHSCIATWVRKKPECPVCRVDLRNQPPQTSTTIDIHELDSRQSSNLDDLEISPQTSPLPDISPSEHHDIATQLTNHQQLEQQQLSSAEAATPEPHMGSAQFGKDEQHDVLREVVS